jgi:hypothetical protein
MSTETEFLSEHRASLSPLERALSLDAAADARADAAERQEEAARAAAAQERVDLLQLACHQGGISVGVLQRRRVRAEQADDEIRDLSDQLERAQARRTRAHESITVLTAQMDSINRAVASRSASGMDLLAPAKQAHLEYVQASRAAMAAAQAGVRAPRPFVSRGGGAARSESCIHCVSQGVDDETSYLLHSDPELNVPVTSPATQAAQAEADRLRALGYSAESARLAAVPLGAGLAVR